MAPVGRTGLRCVGCGYQGPAEASRAIRSNPVDFFPYRSMRPFQREALEKIVETLSSKRFAILEAPVGFGKSAVAAAVCSYLGSAHILTATKQLQDQYAHDFGLPTVKGKPNFRCLIPSSTGSLLPCSKGRCEADWSLSDCPHYLTFEEYQKHRRKQCNIGSRCEHLRDGKLCRYYDQKWSGFTAPVTIYNYPFLLSEIRYAQDVPHRRLLVCDEVHDLEKQIVGFASFSLRKTALQRYHDETRPTEPFIIVDRGIDEAAAWLDVLSDVKEMLNEFSTPPHQAEDEQEQLAACEAMLKDLDGFIENLKTDPSNWVVDSIRKAGDGSVEEVVFQPILVGGFTRTLFEAADRVLLMSATISSKERLCNVLGVEKEQTEFIQIRDSTFPIENRPIHSLDVARLNRATMDTALSHITQAIDTIMDRHSDERGVIHTTSYKQANHIIQNVSELNRQRLVTTEGSFDRSTLMKIHGKNDASVLISPSLYHGVDLKDETSRFQVIVKVPYPDLSHRRIRVKLQRDREWYDWQTALRLVQTYGRSVRSEDDHAVTYVLDSNFTHFLRTHPNLFPKFFLDALTDRKQSFTEGH
jgi:ATP-dependent DNA helicase DinG